MPAIVAMCEEPEVIRFTSVPVPYSADDAQLWLDLHPGRLAAGDGAAFAITEGGDDRPVGSIGVRVLHDQGSAETGYHVVRDARGRGLATAALRLLARWTFAELEVGRLQLTTHLDNPSLAAGRREGRVHPRGRAAGVGRSARRAGRSHRCGRSCRAIR